MKQIECRISAGKTTVKLFAAGQSTLTRAHDLLADIMASAIGRDDLKDPALAAQDALQILRDRIDEKPKEKATETPAAAEAVKPTPPADKSAGDLWSPAPTQPQLKENHGQTVPVPTQGN